MLSQNVEHKTVPYKINYEVPKESKMKKSRIILSMLLCLILTTSLVACGEDSGDDDAGSKGKSGKYLKITDSGYDISGEKGDYYLHYSVIIKNTNKDAGVELPGIRVTAYDKDGEVMETADESMNSIYPGMELGFASQAFGLTEKPFKVDFEILEPEDWISGDDFKHANFKQLKVEKAEVKDNGYGTFSITGQLTNENDYDLGSVAVSVLYKDKDGNLKGGETEYVNNIKAGATVPFETLGYDFDYDDYIVYTQPW